MFQQFCLQLTFGKIEIVLESKIAEFEQIDREKLFIQKNRLHFYISSEKKFIFKYMKPTTTKLARTIIELISSH